MRYISLSLLSGILTLSATSQVAYHTISGHVVVVGVHDSTRVIAESHKAIVILNYETAEIQAKIDLKTLDTGIDSLNAVLQSGSAKIATFNGKMGIDKVRTRNHPQQAFDIPGTMTINSISRPAILSAMLTHLSNSNTIACMLSATLTVRLSDFDLQNQLAGYRNSISIQIAQSVLRRASE